MLACVINTSPYDPSRRRAVGTNHVGQGGIFPGREPMARGEGEYVSEGADGTVVGLVVHLVPQHLARHGVSTNHAKARGICSVRRPFARGEGVYIPGRLIPKSNDQSRRRKTG
eukprot:1192551-Prorocentrum_minimum.AAC.8